MTTDAPAAISRQPWWVTPGRAFLTSWHPAQQRLWSAPNRELGMIAGSGGGKTVFGAPWLYWEARERPGEDFIAMEPTWAMVSRVMLPEFRKITRACGGEVKRSEQYVEVETEGKPSRIWLASAENPERVEGIHSSGAWCDEAGQYSSLVFETIRRRCALRKGRILWSSTPYDLGALKVELYDRWASGDPHYRVVQFASTANPSYPAEEMERARATMPAWRFAMFHLGQFTRPENLIYGDYLDTPRHEGGHLVADFDIPAEWPRYAGVDFGAVNTATVWVAHDPAANVFYVYHETLEGGKTTAEHVAAFNETARRGNYQMALGGAPGEQQQRWDWGAAGAPVQKPYLGEVEQGIDRVIGLIKTRRLFVFESLRGLRAELGSYARVMSAEGVITEKIKDKETFHRCFVAGTMVTTSRGEVPIESVVVGDMALTRAGWRPIVAAGVMGKRRVKRVGFSDGRQLVGTPDHPVWVSGRGWTMIDALRYGDIIEALPESRGVTCSEKRRLSSTALDSLGIQIARGCLMRATSRLERMALSIAGYGNTIMDLFRPAFTYITRTATPTTTTYRTLNWFQPPSTHRTITGGLQHQRSWKTLIEYAPLPRRGTDRLRGANGIQSTVARSGKEGGGKSGSAPSAARPFKRVTADRLLAFAQMRVGRKLAACLGWTTSTPFARFVASPSERTDTPHNDSARLFVEVAADAIGVKRQTVYNLTVADRHEYFANGVLVSNCDALRYVSTWLAYIDGAQPEEKAA